jgi:catechol 2,3-dioxygenase-like lactoylglutathione lyase family enzyme
VIQGSVHAAPMTQPIVLDHVGLVVADLEASRRFYAAALAPLGFAEIGRDDSGGTGYGVEGEDGFWIGPALDSPPTRNVHVAFGAAGTEQVDAFFAAALAAGGTERVAPGVQLQYSDRYYAAFVNDPDGNNIEAVFHAPAPLTGRTEPPPASC